MSYSSTGNVGAPGSTSADGQGASTATARGISGSNQPRTDNSERIEELATTLHLLIQKFNPLRGKGTLQMTEIIACYVRLVSLI